MAFDYCNPHMLTGCILSPIYEQASHIKEQVKTNRDKILTCGSAIALVGSTIYLAKKTDVLHRVSVNLSSRQAIILGSSALATGAAGFTVHRMGLERINTLSSTAYAKTIHWTKAKCHLLRDLFIQHMLPPTKAWYKRTIGMLDVIDVTLISTGFIAAALINIVACKALGAAIISLTGPLGLMLSLAPCLYARHRIQNKHTEMIKSKIEALKSTVKGLKWSVHEQGIQTIENRLSADKDKPEFSHLKKVFKAIVKGFNTFKTSNLSWKPRKKTFITCLDTQLLTL